jgi:hypothetical protein
MKKKAYSTDNWTLEEVKAENPTAAVIFEDRMWFTVYFSKKQAYEDLKGIKDFHKMFKPANRKIHRN